MLNSWILGATCTFDTSIIQVANLRPLSRYRLVRGYFIESKALEDYDPFASQKIDTFRKSGNGVYRLSLL